VEQKNGCNVLISITISNPVPLFPLFPLFLSLLRKNCFSHWVAFLYIAEAKKSGKSGKSGTRIFFLLLFNGLRAFFCSTFEKKVEQRK